MRHCVRYKRTSGGRRCAEFAGSDDFSMDGGFGAGIGRDLAGPLIGGGVTQVATLATKMLGRGKKIEKWGAGVGLGAGILVSGILAFRQSTRDIGITGLVVAGLVGLPRLIEDLMGPAAGSTAGYLGIHTAEADMAGYLGADDSAIQLLDSGGGLGVGAGLGVITAEEEVMAGAMGAGVPDVALLGAQRSEAELFGSGGGAAFGANFLSHQ